MSGPVWHRHGMTGTRVYAIWKDMKSRCTCQSNSNWCWYGERGISVCDGWMWDFPQFLRDMGHPPTNKHTIDRIDSNGNYEPSNCRWATMKEQQNNKRDNRFITIDGATKTLSQWCEHYKISKSTVSVRMLRGWDEIRAITEPPKWRRA